MAKESGRGNSSDALKAEIAASRQQLSWELRGLRYEMDIPRRIRRSMREHMGLWIGAAVAVGVIVIMLPRKKEVHVDLAKGLQGKPGKKFLEAGFLLGLLRMAAPLLKPMVKNFITQKMRGRASGRPRSVTRSEWF
jgi:hypothetical protein